MALPPVLAARNGDRVSWPSQGYRLATLAWTIPRRERSAHDQVHAKRDFTKGDGIPRWLRPLLDLDYRGDGTSRGSVASPLSEISHLDFILNIAPTLCS